MSDENSSSAAKPPSPHDPSTAPSEAATPSPSSTAQDREEFLSRARNFLASPQVIEQDAGEKRRFLVEKGLNESEIDSLMRELARPLQKPAIPPRSYPQAPPSNLPILLLGIIRLSSWIAGASVILAFLYHRLVLPRILRTTLARRSLKSHHVSLLRRLNTSLASLKESQKEMYKVLPQPDPYKEPPEFQKCRSVADVLAVLDHRAPNVETVPPLTLLRCGLADFAKGREGDLAKPTVVELLQDLENQIAWLTSDEGREYSEKLRRTLETCPLFKAISLSTSEGASATDEQRNRLIFVLPTPQEPSPVIKSLNALENSLPTEPATKQSSALHTLQALSDFTGYLTTQIYMPYRTPSGIGGYVNTGSVLSPGEEEFKKEVRALKSLVLNRRSFMSPVPLAVVHTS